LVPFHGVQTEISIEYIRQRPMLTDLCERGDLCEHDSPDEPIVFVL